MTEFFNSLQLTWPFSASHLAFDSDRFIDKACRSRIVQRTYNWISSLAEYVKGRLKNTFLWEVSGKFIKVWESYFRTFSLSSGERCTLRELIARPSGSRTISEPITFIAKSRSRTWKRINQTFKKQILNSFRKMAKVTLFLVCNERLAFQKC